MAGFLLRRVVQAVVLLNLVLLAMFLLLHMTGDPALILLPLDSTQGEIERFRHQMGFDQPLAVQYVRYVRGVLHGDFGFSIEQQEPALHLVLERLPATVELTFAAFVLSVGVSLPLGVIAAYKQNSAWDKGCLFWTSLSQSIPDFWLGILLILLFSVRWRILPSFGRGGMQHLLLPAFAASAYMAARLTRLVRAEMLEVLRQDYIVAARSKGIHELTVLFRHALKNAAIPLVTVMGMDLGILLGGTVVVETVFAWPGLGRLTVEAIYQRDFVVVQTAVFLLAGLFVLINLAVDTLYFFLDPRVRLRLEAGKPR